MSFLAVVSAVGQPKDLYWWQWRNPTPQGNHLNSSCYGSGRFVVVGRLGTTLVSPDGINWSIGTIGDNDELISVAYGKERFVALGGLHRTWLSTNAVTWALGSYGTLPSLNQIRYLNGAFWAVGAAGAVGTSPDGSEWVQNNSGAATLLDIAYGNGKYVAVGWNGAILNSPDGIVWSTRLSGTAASLSCVSFGGAQFVAMGEGGTVLTSTNGTIWIKGGSPAFGYEQIIENAFVEGQFIATGADGSIFTSPDGIGWVKSASGTSEALTGIAFGAGRYSIVGTKGTMLGSTNTSTWNVIGSVASTSDLTGAVAANDIGLVVGDGGTILRTTDGVSWAAIDSGVASRLNRVRFFNSRFWIVGDFGVLLSSVNGTSWSRRAVGDQQADIAFGNEAFVTVGGAAGGGRYIYTSYDATTWTQTFSEPGKALTGIVYADGIFVAVGASGIILTSPDGVVWTQQIKTIEFYEVSYGSGIFVAVGLGGRILTSSDGRDWVERKSGTSKTLLCVSWTGARFVSFGSDAYEQTCIFSPDGENWTTSGFPSAWPVRGVAAMNDAVLVAGDAGSILAGYFRLTSEPELSISQVTGDNVVVSWADYVSGWSLQQAPALQSESWTPVPAPGNTVTLPVKLGTEVFRLSPNLP